MSLRISSAENVVLFFEAGNDHFHFNLSDLSGRPKSARSPIFTSMGFLKSETDCFQSHTAKEHFPLSSSSTFEKTRWKDLLTKKMQEKHDHIEELRKILRRNVKFAQKTIRDLVEVYRDETHQRVC